MPAKYRPSGRRGECNIKDNINETPNKCSVEGKFLFESKICF